MQQPAPTLRCQEVASQRLGCQLHLTVSSAGRAWRLAAMPAT